MSDFFVILPDQSQKKFEHEPTALEVALSIGPRLAKDTLGVKLNGRAEVMDLRLLIPSGSKIELITTKSPEAVEVIRHSAAHIMAQAVQALWPEVKVTIGPVIESGFYYDFDSPFTFNEEHLAGIEAKMQEIIKQNLEIRREDWPKSKALDVFKKMGERFKVELIENLETETVGIYHQGDWFDLCRGPHIQTTGQVKAFKLLSVAGAYWRGDEKNPMLQRIYATAFGDAKDLELHLKNLEEAKKRDHRKLGKELGLFTFHEYAPGGPFFTGKGTVIYTQLQNYMRELYQKYGYQEVITPQIFDAELFHKSGHYENYLENMYFTKIHAPESAAPTLSATTSVPPVREFASKPINCPPHCLLYKSEKHSYRELPLKIADFGRLHRYEKSGALHGLTRVTSFCQDDAHIFCSLDQLQTEIGHFINLLNEVYSQLGMNNYRIYFSTRPEKRMGSDEVWDKAESALEMALKALNLPYTLNAGDGAFYGPKLDIMFVDALQRPWQLGTLQCDFNMPENFELTYVGEDNKDHRPVMLHRAVLGSLERFIGIYLEHTAGHWPLWLAPVQVSILNVTDRVNSFCEELESLLHHKRVRVVFDRRNEKLNYKIREAQLQKIPYMLIIGDNEAKERCLTVRFRDGSNFNNIPVDTFLEKITNSIQKRDLELCQFS